MNKISMQSDEKLNIIHDYLVKLKHIAKQATQKKSYDCALSALSAASAIQYSINQVYTDTDLEDNLLEISSDLITIPINYSGQKNTVLFYDGFGLDLRGWAASFSRALSSLDYRVVFVEPLHAKGNIPHIVKELEQGNGLIEYIDIKGSYVNHINKLNQVIIKYAPMTTFFYTTPDDVAGTVVFNAYKGLIKRIQIDLTDHAFWIGVNAVDYCTESREVGASNAIYHRGFSKEQLLKMDGCPYINRDIDPSPFPFDIEKEKYVFSGGALYKTLGDEALFFYKIVDHILSKNKNIKFIYAGTGDDTEIKKAIQKYPNRVFLIQERSDFIRLLENCIFFLNTYPMFGGLMMRYSAMVGKIPLTLKHGSDHEGILYDQSSRGIEFDSFETVIEEADKLISDPEYRRRKEDGLKGTVITEDEYARDIKMIIEEGKTGTSFNDVNLEDTTEFQAEYLERLKPFDTLRKDIARKRNLKLIKYFPILFIGRAMRRKQ